MNINKGMNFVTNPRDIEDGTWRTARNILLSRGWQSSENEGGFDPNVLDFGIRYEEERGTQGVYTDSVKGWILTPTCAIIFTKRIYVDSGNYKSIVWKYDYNHSLNIVYEFDSNTPIEFKNWITGIYTYNYKGELIIVWCDGIDDESNEILTMNVDDVSENIEELFFNPNTLNKKVVAERINGSGRLRAGTYFIAIAGVLEDRASTAYTLLSNKVFIYKEISTEIVKAGKEDEIIPDSIIQATFTGIDSPYARYNLAVIYDNGLTRTGYVKSNLKIKDNNIIKITDLSNFVVTDVTNIITPVSPYLKSNSLAIVNKDNSYQLLMSGVAYSDTILSWEEGQELAKNVILELSELSISSLPKVGTTVLGVFQSEEIYCFYMGVKDTKGNVIGIWHIPAFVSNELPGVPPICPHIGFDLHENINESYPDEIGVNTNVRHLKIPALSDATTKVYTVHATVPSITNPNIGEIFICHAKRDFTNNRIIGTDVTHNKLWYERADDVHDPHSNLDLIRFRRGHCFDLMLNKVSLTSINKIEFIYSYAIQIENQDVIDGMLRNNVLTIPYNEWGADSEFRREWNVNGSLEDDGYKISLEYIPNDTSVYSNYKGESCIMIKVERLDTDTAFIDLVAGTEIMIRAAKRFIRYISERDNYYFNYYNQELVICGTTIPSSISTPSITLQGDTSLGNHTIRLSQLRRNKIYPGDVDDTDLNTVKALFNTPSYGIIPPVFRIEGTAPFEKVFPLTSSVKHFTKNPDYPASRDNFIDAATGKGYNRAYNSWDDFHQGVSNPDDIVIDKNSNYIARSDVYSSEALAFNLRNFRPDAYYAMPLTMGLIIGIFSDGFTVFIQLQYELFIATVKDVLQMNEGQLAYLGAGDIFDRPPRPLLISEDGHIGCKDIRHARLTPMGYFVVDKVRARAILVEGGKPLDIGFDHIDTYLKEQLVNHEPRIGFDYNNRRLFIHFTDSESISYSVAGKIWVSLHDYNISNALSFGQHVIYLFDNDSKLTRYTDSANYGKYGEWLINRIDDNIKDSYIDIYYTKQPLQAKLLQSLVWKSISNLQNISNYKDTIDYIMVYNDNQCTGLLPVNKNNEYYDTETGVLINGVWYFNKLNDAVINDMLPILDNNNMPTDNVNIQQQDWFRQSKFICDYAIARLGINNVISRKLILNFVDFMAQLDNR